MYNFLLSLDFLGPSPNLYYNSQQRYKTLLGSLITIVMGLLSILAFIGFGYNLLARQNPTGVYNKDINEDISIGKDELFFLFTPNLPKNGRLLTDDYDLQYRMFLRQVNTDTISEDRITNNTVETVVQLVRCTETERYKTNYLNVTSFMTVNHSDYFCTPDDANISAISGKQGTAKFNFWSFIMEYCNNKTMNNTCYSKETIQAKHSKVVMQLLYSTAFVTPKDFSNPIKYLYNAEQLLLDTKATRNDFYYFKNTEVVTDEGWIMESWGSQRTFQFNSFYNQITPSSTSNTILQIDIAMDNLKDVYSRKYLKLQDVLASAGGFVKMFVLVFSIAMEYINNKLIYQSIYLRLLEKQAGRTRNGEKRGPNISNINNQYSDVHIIKKIDFSSTSLDIISNNKKIDGGSNMNIGKDANIHLRGNTFIEGKKHYHKLNIFQILCQCGRSSANFRVVERLCSEIKKCLSVENIMVKDIRNRKGMNLIWGENGYPILKYLSMRDFVNKMNSLEKRKTKNYKQKSLDMMIKSLHESRVVDTNILLKSELEKDYPSIH
jgi:hypothetical protein